MGIAKPTATFLLPLICKNQREYKQFYTENLTGVYYKDNNKPDWGIKIILVYKKTAPLQVLQWYEKSELKYEQYVDEDEENNKFHILSFIIPPKYRKDAMFIINAEYEKISGHTTRKILSVYPAQLHDFKSFLTKLLETPHLLPRTKKDIIRYPFKDFKNEVLNIANVPIHDEDVEAIKQGANAPYFIFTRNQN